MIPHPTIPVVPPAPPNGATRDASSDRTPGATSSAFTPRTRFRLRPRASMAAALWLSAACLGCVPSLEQNPPRNANRAVPAMYHGAMGAAAASGAQGSGVEPWRRFFTDPDLRDLIETALDNNQELNIRLQEVIIAENQILSRKGEYLPKVRAGAGAGIEKVGELTSQGASDEATGLAQNLQNYIFGFSASWELDVWRKLRNATDAAAHRYLASVEGRHFMVTRLVAEIANGYYELMALDNQLDVLARNIAIQEDALELVKLQQKAARVTRLAVQRFEAEVLKNRSRRYELEQRRIETENRLNFLAGRFPQPVARRSRDFKNPLPNVVRVGLPSQLLDNRPDLRQAAEELAAAELDVEVTRAEFYPSLSIDAAIGYESFNLKHLVMTPESLAYNAAANLALPVINRRAIEAEYLTANAEQITAVLNYERTILEAFTEVVNLLAMTDNLQKGYDLQRRQVDVLEESIEVSNVLFQSARADYTEVLLTRRDALDAEMELIETKRRQFSAMVNIYQALGGGWSILANDAPANDAPGPRHVDPRSDDAHASQSSPHFQPIDPAA